MGVPFQRKNSIETKLASAIGVSPAGLGPPGKRLNERNFSIKRGKLGQM